MAANQAVPFPVYGQAFRLYLGFRDTSGNLIVGWAGAACLLSLDGAASVSGPAPVEIATNMGVGYVDLTAAQMSCDCLSVKCTLTNTNWTAFAATIYPMVLTQFSGRADAQSVLRFEQYIKDILALVGWNGASATGAAETFFNEDGSTHFGSTVTQSSTTGARTKTQ